MTSKSLFSWVLFQLFVLSTQVARNIMNTEMRSPTTDDGLRIPAQTLQRTYSQFDRIIRLAAQGSRVRYSPLIFRRSGGFHLEVGVGTVSECYKHVTYKATSCVVALFVTRHGTPWGLSTAPVTWIKDYQVPLMALVFPVWPKKLLLAIKRCSDVGEGPKKLDTSFVVPT